MNEKYEWAELTRRLESSNAIREAEKKILIEEIEENERLRRALRDIIEEQPNPTLPYGIRVVEIAKNALSKTRRTP